MESARLISWRYDYFSGKSTNSVPRAIYPSTSVKLGMTHMTLLSGLLRKCGPTILRNVKFQSSSPKAEEF